MLWISLCMNVSLDFRTKTSITGMPLLHIFHIGVHELKPLKYVLMHQLAVLPKQLLNDACLDKFKMKMAPA
jgi:hypothetical protein